MSDWISRAVLWLFVINLGIALGAGLYEHRIVVPRWITWAASPAGGVRAWDADAARQDNSGLRFWVFVTTVPLTLLTLANLLAAFRTSGPARGWWLAAAAAAVAERAMTFGYFIPTMVMLTSAPGVSGEPVVGTAIRWAQLNHLRHAVLLAALLAALRAFALAYQRG